MVNKDWLTSQLVNAAATALESFGSSAAITASIPASSSLTIPITLADAVAGDPVAVSPNKSMGTSVGVYARSTAGGVEVIVRNFSTTTAATLTAVTFKANVIKEVS